jgi:hypothetical protein
VVCEGERTEPDYIRGFERHARNATVEIEIPSEHGDPKRLVEIAKDRFRAAAAEARRLRDELLRFDEVWCVFDRDDHPRFEEAISMARANQIALAVSNPCVELWLLLHFRDSPGAQHRRDVVRMLCGQLPNYSKRVDFNELVAGVRDACTRACRLDSEAAAVGEEGRNPTTGFYLLTDSIARTDKD